MVGMFLSIFLTAAQSTAVTPALDIAARLVTKGEDQLVVFTIKNDSGIPRTFDEALSPCAPSELVTVVFVSEGGIGRFVERIPYIADSFSRSRNLLPHKQYECSFNISHWFRGKLIGLWRCVCVA